MKPIKLTDANAEKIEAALDAVNGKASKHAITSYARVAAIAELFEIDLAERGVAKSRQRGAIFEYAPDGKDLPKAYRNSAITTKLVIERRPTGCFLIGVERDRLYPGSSGTDVTHITEEQAELIKEKAFKGLLVSESPAEVIEGKRERRRASDQRDQEIRAQIERSKARSYAVLEACADLRRGDDPAEVAERHGFKISEVEVWAKQERGIAELLKAQA